MSALRAFDSFEMMVLYMKIFGMTPRPIASFHSASAFALSSVSLCDMLNQSSVRVIATDDLLGQ